MYCSPALSSTEYSWPVPTNASRPLPVTSELPQWAMLWVQSVDVLQDAGCDRRQRTRLVLMVGRIDSERPVQASNARL